MAGVRRLPRHPACGQRSVPLPSPLAPPAREPLEAKCGSIRSSLPRTVVLPPAATIARRGHLYVRPLCTRDALVRLLSDGAESLPCRAKPMPFLPEALNAIPGQLGTPERGPSRYPRNPDPRKPPTVRPSTALLDFNFGCESRATIERHPGAWRTGI